jgi:hypothetical protein
LIFSFKCSIFLPLTIGKTYGALCITYTRVMLVMTESWQAATLESRLCSTDSRRKAKLWKY